MQYTFNCWDSFEKWLSRAKHIFLCADFDGTIVPIRPRPEEANLSCGRRRLLEKISKLNSLSLGIISGRALKDIKQKVGLEGLIFAGNHGLEIAYKKGHFIYPAAKRCIPLIAKIARKLAKEISHFPGAVLEEKTLTLSLHYRLVKGGNLPRLKAVFLRAARPYLATGELRLSLGKKVWELRPSIEWDKGKALLWLVRKLRAKQALVIYIGDDLTDEDAFRALNGIGGLSILVGRRKASLARYYLKGTSDTQKFLTAIYKKIACGNNLNTLKGTSR